MARDASTWKGARFVPNCRMTCYLKSIAVFTTAWLAVAGGQTGPSAAQQPQQPALTGFPFSADETLHYSIVWPTGALLGEASLTAHRTETGWKFSFAVDGKIPGFTLKD